MCSFARGSRQIVPAPRRLFTARGVGRQKRPTSYSSTFSLSPTRRAHRVPRVSTYFSFSADLLSFLLRPFAFFTLLPSLAREDSNRSRLANVSMHRFRETIARFAAKFLEERSIVIELSFRKLARLERIRFYRRKTNDELIVARQQVATLGLRYAPIGRERRRDGEKQTQNLQLVAGTAT